MNYDRTIDESPKREAPHKAPVVKWISYILSGSILAREDVRKRSPYIVFVVILGMIYITNTFYAQKLYRKQNNLKESVKELRAKSLTLASIKMTATRQSEILKEIERRGIPLYQPTQPPLVIVKSVTEQSIGDER